MDITINLNDDKQLCLYDNYGKLLALHKPLWTSIDQYKRIRENCNIVKECPIDFPKQTNDIANIYCLDDRFEVKWIIKAPFPNDTFPNAIVWDSEMIETKTEDGFLTLDTIKNSDTFICSSMKGLTVTIYYDTGVAKSVEFTK